MTHVFVHGNPEVDAIWGPLVAALAARGVTDIVLLSPPGFGSPAPDQWDASMGSYANWPIAEMRRCILALRRGAIQPATAHLGERLADIALPHGLGIIATADSYVPAELRTAATSTLSAGELRLEALGHWWMVEDPDQAALGLIDFQGESG
jgi:hypothetical protein